MKMYKITEGDELVVLFVFLSPFLNINLNVRPKLGRVKFSQQPKETSDFHLREDFQSFYHENRSMEFLTIFFKKTFLQNIFN